MSLAHTRQLEICAETLQACVAASDGGADRIELCAALAEGGVSPSLGLLREAVAAVSIPVHVLLRPRTGDFHYSDAEFRAICHDAEDALTHGAAGLVVGMLTTEYMIDVSRMRTLMRCTGDRPVTFHRAFDHVASLKESLKILTDLGCHRVLTSGGKPTVMEGLNCLQQLAGQSNGRLRVAAGGGVTLANAPILAKIPNLDLHASLKRKAPAQAAAADPLWDQHSGTIQVEDVRSLAAIVHEAT